jgi:protein phosphatase
MVNESPLDLVSKAMEATSNEFLQHVENTIASIDNERMMKNNLQILGNLVKLPPKGEAVIIGDIHGNPTSLIHILNECNFMKVHEDKTRFLIFLGDYGDRGFYSPEVYYIVLRLKELFPERVILLRGNHEGPTDLLAYPHDLPSQLNRKFGQTGERVYSKLLELFDNLYTAVLIEERYLLLHGGVPSHASSLFDIAYAHEKHPRESHFEEILWSDPLEGINGTSPSPRGAGRLFGENVTRRILEMLDVKVLIRGHEPTEHGFKFNHNGKVLTIFSRKGPPYHNFFGAYLQLELSQRVEKSTQLHQRVRKF